MKLKHGSLFEDTNPRDLKELLAQIHSKELALPDFQRDFVWDPAATQELIVSIANGYPAGSILRIKNTREYFAAREVEGAPALGGSKPTYLVLDGQQRLTSLYQAFYGAGDHRYYVDLKHLIAGKDFEDCIFHLQKEHRRVARLETAEVQTTELILPLRVLLGEKGGFSKWAWKISMEAGSPEKTRSIQEHMMALQHDWVETIDDYRFPVVTLSDQTPADAVCTIFETLNRTGVKLTAFELLTARFWPQNLNLRALWDKAQEDHPIIKGFDLDPYYLMQVAALLRKDAAPSCKRSDVLKLDAEHVRKAWDDIVWGLAEGLKILRDDCGVWLPQWLPYGTIVIPLAAIIASGRGQSGADVGLRRKKVARWFWCSVFGQTYENSPNSQAATDFAEVVRWLDGGVVPTSIHGFRFDPEGLRTVTPRQRALYRGVMALVMRRGPRDFHKGDKLNGDLVLGGRADDHHVFPAAYLARQSVTERVKDGILNRTLIDRETNQRIGMRPPSQYLKEIKSKLGPTLAEVLASHLLPDSLEDSGVLLADRFSDFLNARLAIFSAQIQQVTESSPQSGWMVAPESSSPLPASSTNPTTIGTEDEAEDEGDDTPWTKNGEAWHLKERCSPDTLAMLATILTLLKTHAPDAVCSWKQRNYIAFKLFGERWIILNTGKRRLELGLWTMNPRFTSADLAKRLGIVVSGDDEVAEDDSKSKSNVNFALKVDCYRIRLRLRSDFDVKKPEFSALLKEWRDTLNG